MAPPPPSSTTWSATSIAATSTCRCSTKAASCWCRAPSRAAPRPSRPAERHRERLPWRQPLTEEYASPESGQTYLFIYRIPKAELAEWHLDSLLWPASAMGIALVVMTLFSLLLTLSITRPLDRLRSAVHDLGRTTYQQHSLARLARRRDELGVLARDFNRMGARLQDLIGSQRQLLRDVSHELRSPLARLRVALALAERADPEARARLWPRLGQECDRLEALTSEILELGAGRQRDSQRQPIDLPALLGKLREDARLLAPEQAIRHRGAGRAATVRLAGPARTRAGQPAAQRRALQPGRPASGSRRPPRRRPAEHQRARPRPRRRRRTPGAPGRTLLRAPGQASPGHGLGLAIARRAAQRHGGQLGLANHPDGGFVATLELPLGQGEPAQHLRADRPAPARRMCVSAPDWCRRSAPAYHRAAGSGWGRGLGYRAGQRQRFVVQPGGDQFAGQRRADQARVSRVRR